MFEVERERVPDWVQRERFSDLAWIVENLYGYWPAVQIAYKQFGRGAAAIDMRVWPTGEGCSLLNSDLMAGWYVPQEVIEQSEDNDAIRMVAEYDPTREMVTILLKPQDRVRVYRVGVPNSEEWVSKLY